MPFLRSRTRAVLPATTVPRARKFLRIAGLVLLVSALGTAIFFALLRVLLPAVAWLIPALEPFFFELGAYGVYRLQRYVTLDIPVPRGNMVKWDDSCADGGLVFLAPFGHAVGGRDSRPLILDTQGELVWVGPKAYPAVTNVDVQVYKDTRYLTFWAGDKHGGEGSGTAYMLDSSYNVFKEIHAVGPGLRTDLHEFAITADGTALISTINNTFADLTPLGWGRSAAADIEDSVLQEIDVETGELLFQWRATDHFSPPDSHFWNPIGGYTWGEPYDFFHLNSAQKDAKGNYLISARHMYRLLYLDGATGDVLWSLGHGADDFTDLSDGKATNFEFQHHARWHPDPDATTGLITVMNNANSKFQLNAPDSQALLLRLDTANRTVQRLHAYTTLDDVRAPSQGSVQILSETPHAPPGLDNVFVGWGPMGLWTEHARHTEEVLCEYHFAAGWWFWWERVKNYRTLKVYGWEATPAEPPVARLKAGKVYVSWNGATGVQGWRLEGRDGEEGEWREVQKMGKTGFESSFALPRGKGEYAALRAVALDADGKAIGTSEPATEVASSTSAGTIVFVTLFVVGLVLGLGLIFRTYRARRRREGFARTSSWELPTWERAYKYDQLSEDEDEDGDEESEGRDGDR